MYYIFAGFFKFVYLEISTGKIKSTKTIENPKLWKKS